MIELIDQGLKLVEAGGISFKVKTKACAKDAFELRRIAPLKASDPTQYGRELVRLFTTGWEGVVVGGKPAPFSYLLMETGLPHSAVDTVWPVLAQFILNNVDILKQ